MERSILAGQLSVFGMPKYVADVTQKAVTLKWNWAG